MNERKISQAVIRRLPRYYRYLGELLDNGVERISSNELSKRMKVTASQIRQDLNNFGKFFISIVSCDLSWENEKALSAFDGIRLGNPFCIIGHQCSGSGNNIVEKIVVSGHGTKGMTGVTLFISILIHTKINKIFMGKNMKKCIAHNGSFQQIYLNASLIAIIT